MPSFLCVVWALGDKLNCPAFQDYALLQLMAHYHETHLESDVLVDAYRLTPPGSKLRQYVVDEFLFQITWGSSEEESGDFLTPGCWNIDRLGLRDFKRDALTRMVETRGIFRAPSEDAGRYLLLLYRDVDGELHLED